MRKNILYKILLPLIYVSAWIDSFFTWLGAIFVRVFLKLKKPKFISSREYYDGMKRKSKRELIREMLRVVSEINDNDGYITREYFKQLKSNSRKTLLKALMSLNYAKTLKHTKGKKP